MVFTHLHLKTPLAFPHPLPFSRMAKGSICLPSPLGLIFTHIFSVHKGY